VTCEVDSTDGDGNSNTMKISSKGQVTIPRAFRIQFGFLPNTEILFVADKSGLRIIKSTKPVGKGTKLIAYMRGRGDGRLSTAQIMKTTRR
jgi:bifunctional DNA-binding transcriptional regulator/antitoxin component of YhaV-PrlF toxin-antitoxin module